MPPAKGTTPRQSAEIKNQLVFLKALKNFYSQIIETPTSNVAIWEKVLKECQKKGCYKNRTARCLSRTRWPGFIRKTVLRWESKKELDERDKLVIEIERLRTPNYCFPMNEKEEKTMTKKEKAMAKKEKAKKEESKKEKAKKKKSKKERAKKEEDKESKKEEDEVQAENNDETMNEEDDDPQMEEEKESKKEEDEVQAENNDETMNEEEDELEAGNNNDETMHEEDDDPQMEDYESFDDIQEPLEAAATTNSHELFVDESSALQDKFMESLPNFLFALKNIEGLQNTKFNTSNTTDSHGSNDTTNHLQQEFYRAGIRLFDDLYEILKDEMIRRNLTTSGNSNGC